MKFEHVGCDLCGSDDYRVRYRKPDNWLWLNLYEYPVVECVSCGLVYVNPRPAFEDMGCFYPPGYHHGRGDQVHLHRYKTQFEYIASFTGDKLLDIGCARGDWLSYVGRQRPGIELHGVDAFCDTVTDSSIRFRNGLLPDMDLPADYFDLVTSWAVFEHVHTPSDYFRAVSRILRPGGKFVCLVTNAESIYGRYAYKEDIPRHLYHFSEGSLKGYAERHGLIVDAVAYDERFWDGSGRGAFRYAMARLAGISWRDMRLHRFSPFGKAMLGLGSILDALVFCCPWEAHIRRSGIIVATISKRQR
jgi:SAM-dependent methyltransferase